MKLQGDIADERTVGTKDLCAWATSESTCRIQTRIPQYAKRIPKLVEAERVGYGVKGGYLAIFAVRRTLPWVEREVVNRILCENIKEIEGSKTVLPAPEEKTAGGMVDTPETERRPE